MRIQFQQIEYQEIKDKLTQLQQELTQLRLESNNTKHENNILKEELGEGQREVELLRDQISSLIGEAPISVNSTTNTANWGEVNQIMLESVSDSISKTGQGLEKAIQ